MTIVAIDFGTSNTVVSIIEADTKQPKTLKLPEISRLFQFGNREENIQEIAIIPSLIFIKEANEFIVGEKVRSQRLGNSQPQRLFKNFKRDLASDFQQPARQIDGNNYNSRAIAELFINVIYQQLKQQNIEVSELILTVPVGAFERYLDWLRNLVSLLDIPKIKLVDESTAAALGYAIHNLNSLVLVVDFGGGTLDLSLVRTVKPTQESDRNLKAEVLAKADAYVGGEDINIWIVEDYLRRIGSSKESVDIISWQNLLEIAEKLKISLSDREEAKETWFDELNFMSHELKLTRNSLEAILEKNQLLDRLRNTLDEIIAIALSKGINKTEIEQVLLVGGSCLIPAIQQLIISYFGREKVKLDKPFEAVSHGALAVAQLTQIDDYLHHSYAIRLWDSHSRTYTYFNLFESGTTYPCRREEALALQVATEGQTEISLDIGEVAQISQAEVSFDRFGLMTSSQLLKHSAYRSLLSDRGSVCIAHLDPPGELGIDRVSIEFEVDEKRILLATVKDLLTGKLLVEKQAIARLK
jgi:molecular chaperone DnaK (HSP70)